MQVQGSPTQVQEFRIAYVEEGRAMPRYAVPIRVPAIEPKRESPKEKKPKRWSFSNLLVGNCPEFLEAFSGTS